MNDSEKINDMHDILLKMKKESRAQSIESKIQTIALIAVFIFGVATLSDLIKKTKSKLGGVQ